jgi:hypothetical protein
VGLHRRVLFSQNANPESQYEWLGPRPRTRMVPCPRIRISASLPRERIGVDCGSGITSPHRKHFNTHCPPLPQAGWLSTKTGSHVHRDPAALGQDVVKVRACACAALSAHRGISVGGSWALQNQRYSVGTGRLSILALSMRFGQLFRG